MTEQFLLKFSKWIANKSNNIKSKIYFSFSSDTAHLYTIENGKNKTFGFVKKSNGDFYVSKKDLNKKKLCENIYS